jgi:intracellular septation protein
MAPHMTETPQTPSPSGSAKKGGARWVRLVSDLGPALVFFFAYQWTQKNGVPAFASEMMAGEAILFATAVFLPAAIAGFVFSWIMERSLSPIGIFSFVMIAVFSGLALWLKDDTFIKMRPTLIYALMGSILLVSVAARRNLLKAVFGSAMHMAEQHWRALTVRAGIMYLGLAIINEAVWRTQPEATWVTYNTWGDVAINMIFWIVNISLLAKHLTDENGVPLSEKDS